MARLALLALGVQPTSLWAAEAKDQTAAYWLVRPAQTEPKLLAWAKQYPTQVALEPQKTLGGHTAYAVTVTNRSLPDGPKRKLLVAQPHAHEPATTAGMMNVLAQLLDGVDLLGRPTTLDRRRILDQTVLTFIPDGNPDGRAKAPADWWDGSQYSNQEFLDFVFGREADGRRAKRVGRWSAREHQPALIGFVYEKINDHEYVEPNRDRESTYFKLILRMRERYEYDLLLDLHQTEFERSPYNAMILLPFMQKQLPEPIQDRNVRWGRAIIEAWRALGEKPMPDPVPLGYGEDQIQYFRKCWGEIYQRTPCLGVEVQTNSPRTPPRAQMALIEASIRASIDRLLEGREEEKRGRSEEEERRSREGGTSRGRTEGTHHAS